MKNEQVIKLIQKADIDLKTIENLLKHEDSPPEAICFHAQQAVEKYLKAYLSCLNIRYNPSHDLDYLIDLISELDKEFEKYYDLAEELTPYAVGIRYETDLGSYDDEDASHAYEIAIKIKTSVLSKINS